MIVDKSRAKSITYKKNTQALVAKKKFESLLRYPI